MMPFAPTIHASGDGHLLRDRHEELPEQEDGERVTEERGHDQRRQVIDPAQPHEDDVERHDRDLEGQH
jgi:hypothetical protein